MDVSCVMDTWMVSRVMDPWCHGCVMDVSWTSSCAASRCVAMNKEFQCKLTLQWWRSVGEQWLGVAPGQCLVGLGILGWG